MTICEGEKDEIPSGDPSEINSSSDVDQNSMVTKAQKVACNSKACSSSSSENNSTSPIVNNDNAELPSTRAYSSNPYWLLKARGNHPISR